MQNMQLISTHLADQEAFSKSNVFLCNAICLICFYINSKRGKHKRVNLIIISGKMHTKGSFNNECKGLFRMMCMYMNRANVMYWTIWLKPISVNIIICKPHFICIRVIYSFPAQENSYFLSSGQSNILFTWLD